MSRVKDMTQGSPAKHIFFFALPLILGSLGQQIYMITDTVIVGRGVGVSALASLGATDWIYWLVLWTLNAATQGFSILITQNFGSGDEKNLKRSITMSVWLSIALAALLTAASLLMAKPLLLLLQTPADIFDGALSYVMVMYAGTFIVMGYSMASSILRSFGDGKSPLIAMLVAAALNIGLDLLFVMGFGWGIVGAAAATLIAQLAAFTYCFAMIRRIPVVRNLQAGDWRIELGVVNRLCRLGLPLALQHIIIVLGGIILQFVINGYGALFVAGFTATNKLYGVLESSAISFGFATSTFVAQNWGANRLDRVEQGVKSSMKLSVVCAAFISVNTVLFGKFLLRMFVSPSEANAQQVLDIAYRYLVVMSLSLFLLYLLFTYRSALQGLGNTLAPMLSGIIEFFARASVALFLPMLIGEYGIFFAESAAWLSCTTYLIFIYYRQMKRIKSKGLTFHIPAEN